MKLEAQRISIAEWCGWKISGTHSPNVIKGDDGFIRISPDGQVCVTASLLPDYLNDLNAMHEVEGHLNREQVERYLFELGKIVELQWRMCRATAAQRAEALLRTIGKWDDDK